MDYEVPIKQLTSRADEFSGTSTNVGSKTDSLKESLNAFSSTEISGIINATTTLLDRLKNGFSQAASWQSEYTSSLEQLESSLTNSSDKYIEPFLGEFENVFAAITARTFQNGKKGKKANVVTSEHSLLGVPHIQKAMDWALAIANDNSHGYSQNTRYGNPNYDCSSLVIAAYENAGIPVQEAGASYTGNMRSAFLKCGFIWIPGNPDVSSLQPGDILLNEGHHTEMYIGNGKNVGAHDNFDGRNGDSSGREINVSPYRSYPWNGVLRYVGNKNA